MKIPDEFMQTDKTLPDDSPKPAFKVNGISFNFTLPVDYLFVGHSKTTLTRFWSFLTAYPPLVGIFKEILLIFMRENLYVVDIL